MKEKQLYDALVDGIKNRVDIDREEYIDISRFNLTIRNDGWQLLKRAIEQCQEKLDKAVANALSQVKGITEPMEILLRLYDYFAENCVYTWEVATKQIRKAP